ncbi:GspH/FimT family pseudopilin [Pseudothauera rhizosphaerae]|nr:GspH/FimT family pseudopilin [Pseudothauera rhizosphaerae]
MKKTRGFTIIELMLTVAVLAVLLGIGIPSFRNLIQNNRATAIANDIVGTLQTARSEAIKRRSPITVCRRNAAGSACENGTNWAAGWLMLQGATVLKVWDAAAGEPVVTGPAGGIVFQSDGTASATGEFQVQTSSGSTAVQRCVGVAGLGRVSTKTGACS